MLTFVFHSRSLLPSIPRCSRTSLHSQRHGLQCLYWTIYWQLPYSLILFNLRNSNSSLSDFFKFKNANKYSFLWTTVFKRYESLTWYSFENCSQPLKRNFCEEKHWRLIFRINFYLLQLWNFLHKAFLYLKFYYGENNWSC